MSLKAVYEDPARTSRDPRVLASRAGGSVKSAEAFLRDQESSQLAKQAVAEAFRQQRHLHADRRARWPLAG